MSRPWVVIALLGLLVALSVVGAAQLLTVDRLDLAGLYLTFVVLVIGVVSVAGLATSPAKIWVERQTELGLDDLIFMDSDPPLDYLLQLHVAVANTGGRKGVLSGLYLDEFLNTEGQSVKPNAVGSGTLPLPLAAQIARQIDVFGVSPQGLAYRDVRVEISSPPVILEPDDVITLRFRARRGIDWGDYWTLDEIKKFADALGQQISHARLRAVYRQGRRVVSAQFLVDVKTVGQVKYLQKLAGATQNYTVRPVIPHQPLQLE